MTYENFTVSAQDAILKGQRLAAGLNQEDVQTAHLLIGVLDTEDATVSALFKKLNINIPLLKRELYNFVEKQPRGKGVEKQKLTSEANAMLLKAKKSLTEFGDQFITPELMILGLSDGTDAPAVLLKGLGCNTENLKKVILELRQGKKVTDQSNAEPFQNLNKFGINLNSKAKDGTLEKIVGRDEEIRRIIHILSRKTKNNPILVGDNGVGKKSIVEGIVWRIVNKDVPENLLNKSIYMVDLASIVAGAKYKGELEERLKFLLDEVKSSSGQVILFFEDIHNMVGGGRDNSNSEAASIIKLAVARGEVYIIGTTTADDYQKSIESDKVLANALQNVDIEEPSIEETFSILRGTQERFEEFHKVGIADDALKAAAELSARYISEKKLPEKAIDLIDEAASKLKLELNSIPDEIDLIQRKLEQIKAEKNIISKEKNIVKEKELSQQIDLASSELSAKKTQWESEKKLHIEIINLKTRSIELRKKLEGQVALKPEEAAQINEELQLTHKNEEDVLAKFNAIPEADRFVSSEVTADEIAAAISRWTGIPVNKMLKNDKERLLTLEAEIGKRLIGQKEAVSAVCDAVRRSRAGLQDPNKPIGSFLFLGPTGVGKTELAKALAEVLFDDENAITRIDMSEYQEKHAVSRLVGAPPGYVGYDEGGQLTEAVRRRPYSIVLLDEIEKAHPDTFNILLQLLDDGRLTDNKGRTANFRNTIVIMTSNMGSEKILENFEDLDALGDKHKADIIETTKEEVLEILKENLKPEFLNRIDDKIVFTPLSKAEVKQIAKLMLKKVSKNLGNQEMKIEFTDHAMNLLVDMGYDPAFGARPLKRVIDKELVNHLAKAVLGGDFAGGDTIYVGTDKSGFTFNKSKPENEAVPEITEEKKEIEKKEVLSDVEKAAKDLQNAVDDINKDKKQ